ELGPAVISRIGNKPGDYYENAYPRSDSLLTDVHRSCRSLNCLSHLGSGGSFDTRISGTAPGNDRGCAARISWGGTRRSTGVIQRHNSDRPAYHWDDPRKGGSGVRGRNVCFLRAGAVHPRSVEAGWRIDGLGTGKPEYPFLFCSPPGFVNFEFTAGLAP